MGFLGLRSPAQKQLQSNDHKVREAAVKALPTAEQNQLCEIAVTDSHPAVRMTAAARVIDPQLIAVLAKHSDKDIAQLAKDFQTRQQLEQIRTRPYAQMKAAVLALTESSSLTSVALNAEDSQTREAALDQLMKVDQPSEHQLSTLAIQEESGSFGERVLPLISKRQLLKNIAKKAKAETVRQAAQKLIANQEAEHNKPSQERQRKRQAKLLAGLIERARVASVSSKWETADQQWRLLEQERDRIRDEFADVDLNDEAQATLAELLRLKNNYIDRQAEASALTAAQEQAERRKRALLAEWEQALPEDESAIRQQWSQIGDAGAADDALNARFKQLFECEEINEFVQPASEQSGLQPLSTEEQVQVDALIAEAQQLVTGDNLRAADDQLRVLDKRLRTLTTGRQAHAARDAFQAVYQQLKQRRQAQREQRQQQREQRLAQLEQLATDAESLAAQVDQMTDPRTFRKQLDELRSAWRAVGSVPRDLIDDVKKRFDHAMDIAFAPLHKDAEAQEWERFNNIAKAEQLITAMKALLSVDDLSERFEQVKDLQKQWKSVGRLPRERNEALWGAFKQAGDEVFTSLQPMFAERDAQRAAAAEVKRGLLAELRQLVHPGTDLTQRGESTGLSKAERAEAVKALQQRWKEAGPAPRDQDQNLFNDYRGLCDEFFASRRAEFAARDEQRVANLHQKLALIAEAEELAEQAGRLSAGTRIGNKTEADFMREVQEMQRRFRDIGHVPRERMEDIYEKFKSAADAVYAAIEPWLVKQDEERAENLTKKQAILAELKEFLQEERPDWFAEDVRKLQQDWRAVGPVPRADKAINDEFYQTVQRILHPEEFAATSESQAAADPTTVEQPSNDESVAELNDGQSIAVVSESAETNEKAEH